MFKKLIFLILLISVLNCFGWGSGHELITEILIEKLPEEIKSIISQETKNLMIKKWSHYPDSFEKFDKDIISETSLSILEKYGIKTRFDLHYPKGKYVNFILLTKAFEDKNEKEIGLWISSLCHTLSDEGALNHGPLIHYITYGLSPLKIKMGKGIGLDIIEIKNIGGKEIILKKLENYSPKIISENTEETIINILLQAVQSNSFMTQREGKIMKSYKLEKDEKEYEEAKLTMAEIGAKNVSDTIDAIITSYYYSKNGIKVQFEENIIKEFEKKEKEYLEKRPIENDSIYEGLLKTEDKYPAIGIIIEPSQTMNRAIFPFGSKYILSAIMWYLKENGVSYKPIDLREILNKKINLSVEKIPLIILNCGNWVPGELKSFLKEYLKNGGVIFLIAGMKDFQPYKEIFSDYHRYFKNLPEDITPVSPKYGYTNEDVVKKISFYFLNDLNEYFGDKGYKMIRNPNTPAGWQKPVCTIYIENENSKIKKLIKLTDGEKEFFVGVIIEDEKTKIIFIPEYFLSPFIFSEEDTLNEPSKPYLDKMGRKIIDFVLKKYKMLIWR
jgi:hypothetical protein